MRMPTAAGIMLMYIQVACSPQATTNEPMQGEQECRQAHACWPTRRAQAHHRLMKPVSTHDELARQCSFALLLQDPQPVPSATMQQRLSLLL
jgi:hypothetical protein